jgi:hypothetical protein
VNLYHVTSVQAWRQIQYEGIDPAYHQCARAECWYVSPSRLAWAVAHVMVRHSLTAGEVVCLQVYVPWRQVIRRRSGIWTCAKRIERERIIRVGTFEQLAAAIAVDPSKE